jgi:hypothetical protein
MLPLFTILIFHFGIVTTVWYSIKKKKKKHVNLRCIIMHTISFHALYTFFVKSDMKIVCPNNKCSVLFIYAHATA